MKRFLLIFSIALLASCQSSPHAGLDLEERKQELRKIAEADKNQGNFDAASQLETQIIGLDVNDPNSFITLSRTLKKQGLKAKALEILQTGEKLNPDNEALQLEVAKTMLENGEVQPALTKLQTIKTLRNDDYYDSLGVAYDMTGDHKTAQATFEKGLENSPDNGLMLNNLALSYILEGDYDEAIDILLPLTKGPRAKPKYRQNLALAYAMKGNTRDAYLQLIKDLPKDQANENMKFYNTLRKNKITASDVNSGE